MYVKDKIGRYRQSRDEGKEKKSGQSLNKVQKNNKSVIDVMSA